MSRKRSQLSPLKIQCRDSDCENGLHYFKPTKAMRDKGRAGHCRYCDADVVDWTRLHKRVIHDIAYTFEALKQEYVRLKMWRQPVDQKGVNHARRKGFNGLREATFRRIRRCMGSPNPPFDGRQTPRSGNAIYYAQHATATCCRKCMEYWHGIPPDRDLTDEQVDYFTELVMEYIRRRLPFLTHDGEYVPPIRRC